MTLLELTTYIILIPILTASIFAMYALIFDTQSDILDHEEKRNILSIESIILNDLDKKTNEVLLDKEDNTFKINDEIYNYNNNSIKRNGDMIADFKEFDITKEDNTLYLEGELKNEEKIDLYFKYEF